MNISKISKHPSIQFCNDVVEICRPLEAFYNIDYFAHVNVDKKGNFTALGRNPKFVTHYLESRYYNCDIHLINGECREEYVIQDSIGHYEETGQLFQDCADFGLFHIFTIIYRNADSVDAYHFATSKKQNPINEVYLKHLPLLKNFIAYFTERVNNSRELKNAYKHIFKINDPTAMFASDLAYLSKDFDIHQFIQETQLKKFYIPEYKHCYLTKREMQCLLWLHYGKTAPEMEKIMYISERTVRAHINSIKKKLKCQTMYQLGEIVGKLNIIHLLNYQHL